VVDLGPARIGTTPLTVLAIDLGKDADHRLWVDRTNWILREHPDAPGHFMDRDDADDRAAVTITHPPHLPLEVEPPLAAEGEPYGNRRRQQGVLPDGYCTGIRASHQVPTR
jgi:hypothetical protein